MLAGGGVASRGALSGEQDSVSLAGGGRGLKRSERGGACVPGARSGRAVRAAGARARARAGRRAAGSVRSSGVAHRPGAEGRGCGSGARSQSGDSQERPPPSAPRQEASRPGVCGTRWGLESSPEKTPLH